MKNPLNKRFPRELKADFGKYTVIFLFIVAMISAVSGFIVANKSILFSNSESFEKYKIEDGNFELASKLSDEILGKIESTDYKIYENFYKDLPVKGTKSELRVFIDRENVNITSLSEGEFPQAESEIAVANVYAWANKVSVGDSIVLDGQNLKVVGLVSLPDYSSLFSSQTEMMFDLTEFGVAVMSEKGFNNLSENQLHYSYSWKYNENLASDLNAEDKADKFLENLVENSFKTQTK